jgi:lipid-A-disaccharide synthase
MVIGYRVPMLTYAMMRRRALIKDIGLPNILLGERVVPELTQGAATAQGLEAAVLHWLDHPAQAAEMVERFHGLHETLRLGAAQRIAQILSDEFDALARRG